MAFFRVALAAGLVALWFLLYELALGHREEPGSWLRGTLPEYLGEAVLLTALGALWFASLGHGGWVLVFLLLGLLMEWPLRFRGGKRNVKPGRRLLWMAAGVGRIVLAGGILGWILS
ncbi:MAG TPA: hypothetical protein VFL95_04175 [Gemmatimonadales bacterium]|nr:hypothetical protein [Gemmatimonadales bacterium]